jgi:biotin carboxyl carrier protein
MKLWVRIESRERQVEIDKEDGTYVLKVDGEPRIVDCHSAGHRDYLSLIIDNKSHLVECAPIRFEEGKYYANVDGRRYEVDVLDERLLATRQAAEATQETGPYIIASPMPGLIVDVRVKVGDTVTAGSAIVIMEAMKMQNELIAEFDGVVRAINIQTNDAVDSQTPLVEIERAE